LTTAQLLRENEWLHSLLNAKIDALTKQIELLQVEIDRRLAASAEPIAHLQALHDEKFKSLGAETDTKFLGVQTQFIERDRRTEQLSLADKTAIAAALQAQKEAAGAQNETNAAANAKTETNFTKLIDQGQTLLLEVRRNTEAQITDLKSRLDKGEGRSKGLGDGWGYLVGAIGTIALIAAFVLEIMSKTTVAH
jgi:hypothetical protein